MYTPTTLALGTNSADCRAHIFTREDLHLIWEELQPFLMSSIEQSPGWTLEALQKVITDGDAVVFTLFKKERLVWMIVAQFINYPMYRAARIIAHAGVDFKKATEFNQILEDWASMGGAVELEGCCADERVVRLVGRAPGWKKKYTVMSKDLRGKLQ